MAIDVALLDGTGAPLTAASGKPGEPVHLRNLAVKPGEPQYFLALSSARPRGEDAYGLQVTTAPFALDEEEEPNDAPATASPLADVPGSESGVRVGYLPRGDVDCFALAPAPAPRRLRAVLEPPAGLTADLAVVGADGKPVAGPVTAGKDGALRLDDVAVPAAAAVFVRAAARSAGGDALRYRLRWSTTPDEKVPVPGIDE